MKCWIYGTHVGTWEPTGQILGLWPKNIRFASTHFEDGSTVSLRVQAKFKFWNAEPAEEFESEIETTVTVKAYNKLVAWASQDLGLTLADRATCSAAKAKLADSSEPFHSFLGGSPPEFSLGEASIWNHVNNATFIHMASHGTMDDVISSSVSPVETIAWSTMKGYVSTNRDDKPLPNLVRSPPDNADISAVPPWRWRYS